MFNYDVLYVIIDSKMNSVMAVFADEKEAVRYASRFPGYIIEQSFYNILDVH